MSDAESWRSRNAALISALRVVRERFGQEALDLLAAHHRKRVRAASQERAAALGRNDLAALAELHDAPSETHRLQWLRRQERVLEFKIVRCAHAEQYAADGARDFGLAFMCAGDEAMIEGFNPKIRLERPRLLMKGDDCCHFIYRLEE